MERIIKCGVFDSRMKFPYLKESNDRVVDTFEIEYMFNSSGVSYIDGVSYPHRNNSIIIRKPHQVSHSKMPFKCYYLYYDIDDSHKYYSILHNAPNVMYLLEDDEYQSIFENLIRYTCIKKYSVDNDLVQAELQKLLYHIKKDSTLINANPYLMHNTCHNDLVNSAVEYINANYLNGITLRDVADNISYSKNYFQSVFKRALGITPQEYLLKKRLDYAKKLLAESNSSILTVALDSGFASASYFNFVFKKYTNITPLEYRRITFNKYEV